MFTAVDTALFRDLETLNTTLSIAFFFFKPTRVSIKTLFREKIESAKVSALLGFGVIRKRKRLICAKPQAVRENIDLVFN